MTRAPDGTYYLTGTRGREVSGIGVQVSGTTPQTPGLTPDIRNLTPAASPDFLSNDGIKLWSSKDLVAWKDEGLVYDLLKRKKWHDYLSHFYAQPDRPLGAPPVAGIVAPRLHVAGTKFLITLSSCGRDVRWLRADKATGPYTDGRVVPGAHKYQDPLVQSRGPGYGTLFAENDGTTWLVWGPGYLAKLDENLSNIVEGTAELLLARVRGYPNADWCARQFDPHAAALFLKDGKYLLTWAAFTDGSGHKRDDSFYAIADSRKGPFGEPAPLIPGSGPVALFDGGDRGLMASCSMDNRPVLVPLVLQGDKLTSAAPVDLKKTKPTAPAAPKMFDYATSRPSGKRAQKVEATGRSNPVPLFDLPLADLSICRGGDGNHYLTGTVASHPSHETPDFQNNDGIYLWRSADLETWTPLGKVWDLAKDAAQSPKSKWQLDYRIPGDNPVRTDFCRGITGPEIHYAKDTYWIPYSMNGRGTGLLKSTTGKAEGPYEDLGRITAMGESPSLFDDPAAGKTRWLWGKGLQIAELADDRTQLVSAAADLFLAVGQAPNLSQMHTVDMWDLTGPHLFAAADPKTKQRQYCLSFAAVTQTFERANRDAVIALADSLAGPYLGPVRMIPNGGQTSVVADEKGTMFATFSGADPSAVFRDRPGIVPLAWEEMGGRRWPRKVNGDFYTDRGPWAELVPPKGLEEFKGIRDSHVFDAPDGYFYFSASGGNEKFWEGGVRFWRAKDLRGPWEMLPLLYTMEQMRDDPNWPAIESEKDISWNKNVFAWEQAMAFTKGTYWISTWFGGPGWGKDVVWKKSIGALLRSTSGKPEGPYVFQSEWPHDWQGLFVDDGGAVYGTAGAGALWKMSDDLKTMDAAWTGLDGKPVKGLGGKPVLGLGQSVDGRLMSEDCGYQLLKVNGRYVFFGLAGHCSYDMRVFWAKDIRGPYTYMGVVPRLGNCTINKNRDGKWYATHCQTANYNFGHPWQGGPYTYEVSIDFDGPAPSIWPAHDVAHLGEAVYQ